MSIFYHLNIQQNRKILLKKVTLCPNIPSIVAKEEIKYLIGPGRERWENTILTMSLDLLPHLIYATGAWRYTSVAKTMGFGYEGD